MKNIIFETREDYLKFKKDWATYFNTEARHLDRGTYGNKERKLQASHFVIYALIRGRDWKACLHGCTSDTMEQVTRDLKGTWFYKSKIFKEAFNLSDGQIDLIKKAAAKFPENTAPEATNKTREEITQSEEMYA
jgi:hypothetical protein